MDRSGIGLMFFVRILDRSRSDVLSEKKIPSEF